MADTERENAANTEADVKWTYNVDLENDPATKDRGLKGKGFYSVITYADGRVVRNVFREGADPTVENPSVSIPLAETPASKRLKEDFDKKYPQAKAPEVPSSANVTTRVIRANPDGTPQLDGNGKPLEGLDANGNYYPDALIQNLGPGGVVTGTQVPSQQDKNAADLARQRANPAHPGRTDEQFNDDERARKADEAKTTALAESNRLELIRIQTAQRLAGVQEAQLAQSIDEAKKPQKLPDGTFVAWDKNENGEWIARKVNNATSGPKGMAESHDSALADMRLGTVAKASQNYMTELLRRTSLPPNDPEFMTQEQASAAMTSFISEGDIFLREQQGLLGEQNKVQATQLTQRNQDLLDVQSRRNFQQTNVQQAAQHDTDVNKYLSAKDAHLAGPGFLGQIMLTNNLAGQYGGMDAVPQIQQTPLQQNLMAVPAFMGGAPAPVAPAVQPAAVPPAMIVPQ